MAALMTLSQSLKPYYDDGQAVIYHGDCRNVLPRLTDLAGAVSVTDPPYGVGYDLGNDSDHPANRGAVVAALDLCPGTSLLAFGTLDRYVLTTWEWRWSLVWHKPMARAAPAWGISRHYEMCHWYTRGTEYTKPTETTSDVFAANPPIFRVNPETVAHPSQKPVAVVRYLLDRWVAPLVVDPFMGSGTTLRAAKDLGRKAIGIEIEERYCEIAATRLSQQALFGEAS